MSELEAVTFPNALRFEDTPDSSANIEFLTALVGVSIGGTGDLLHFDSTVFRWSFDGGFDELLFFPDLSLKDFNDFTAEEIQLLESIPIIRGNIDPNLISGTGEVSSLGSVEMGDLTSDEIKIIAEMGLGIQSATGFIKPVEIDIKPESDANYINPKSNGVITVAILTTDTFDATQVETMSVEFGEEGATETHRKGHIYDVDEDGDNDMVLHFKTQESGITCGDMAAILTGETSEGIPIIGTDSISTIGCKKIN